MTLPNTRTDPLLRDLVDWVGRKPRRYIDVMDAWRTSCPRLTIWEDAIDHGLIARSFIAGHGDIVNITDKGRAYIAGASAHSSAANQLPCTPVSTVQ